MKRCLITGAGGAVGQKLIASLLESGDCEITAVDLKNAIIQKRLAIYKDKINIVYGDVCDHIFMRSLIKEQDIIFHLAGILPPMSEIHDGLINKVDYIATKYIIDMIKEYNPKAHLIFPSTTAIYGDTDIVSLKSDLNIYKQDFYSQNKYKIEKYIEKELKNYTIYRIPLILDLDDLKNFIYNIPSGRNCEVVSNDLVASAMSKSINEKKKLNRKIFILSGGDNFRTTTDELIVNVLKIHGLSIRYLFMKYSVYQNFYTHYYKDSNKLNDILKFQEGSIEEVYKHYKDLKKFKRCLNRLCAYWFIKKLSK